MVRRTREPWEQANSNFILRFISTVDFSLQVILSTGVVILLGILIALILRDRFQTLNYIVAAIRSA